MYPRSSILCTPAAPSIPGFHELTLHVSLKDTHRFKIAEHFNHLSVLKDMKNMLYAIFQFSEHRFAFPLQVFLVGINELHFS